MRLPPLARNNNKDGFGVGNPVVGGGHLLRRPQLADKEGGSLVVVCRHATRPILGMSVPAATAEREFGSGESAQG
jgi:hypothetical protein